MKEKSREFQIFVKPAGAVCNLRCSYCYYTDKEFLSDNNKLPAKNSDLPDGNNNLQITEKGHVTHRDIAPLTDNQKLPAKDIDLPDGSNNLRIDEKDHQTHRQDQTFCHASPETLRLFNPLDLPAYQHFSDSPSKKQKVAKMPDEILEEYIIQHINASTESVLNFSWHGGEPTLAGLNFFRKVVDLQKKYKPPGKTIINGLQTNGTLLNEEWCRFLARENFVVGISIDGPAEFHDMFRVTKQNKPTHEKVMDSFNLFRHHGIPTEILCVVHAGNVNNPLDIYRFLKETGTGYITFLPLVEPEPSNENGASSRSVPSEGFGDFMISVFDEWIAGDIGKVKIQLFEEALREAFNQDHTLCIFKETCGNVPVVERNGDFYSCDHYVNQEHLVGNIRNKTIEEMLDSEIQMAFGRAKFDSLPWYCIACEVLSMCNGECPRNRFINTPNGEKGLNYLCAGYRKFFNHCRPFIEAIAAAWELNNKTAASQDRHSAGTSNKLSRNEPCHCGSGKKYKHCCIKK